MLITISVAVAALITLFVAAARRNNTVGAAAAGAIMLALFCALGIGIAHAQQPGPRGKTINCLSEDPHKFHIAQYSCDPVVEYALVNRQQEGNFYSFPFPLDQRAMGYSRQRLFLPPSLGARANYLEEPANRASDDQMVLRILSTAEKALKIRLNWVQVNRDPDTGDGHYHGAEYIPPVFHSIYARADSITTK
jgi:hypothetical protein